MRQKCYDCFRPTTSCICDVAQKVKTESEFLILMHPMERQKVKNNTGFITHHSIVNSTLIEGIDFSKNDHVNNVLDSDNFNTYLLFPSAHAKPLNEYKADLLALNKKKNVFIIIDSTWPCAKKILSLSPNLKKAKPLTFNKMYISEYKIKEQPKDGFISTIETVHVMLNDLNKYGIENIEKENLDKFLDPFRKINDYQLQCINDPNKETYTSRLKRNKA